VGVIKAKQVGMVYQSKQNLKKLQALVTGRHKAGALRLRGFFSVSAKDNKSLSVNATVKELANV